MKNKLEVVHPQITAAQLKEASREHAISRSSHVGNQNLRELVLLSNFDIKPILVDTIHGEDKYSKPAYVLNGTSERIAPRSTAKSRVPCRIPIKEDVKKLDHDELDQLVEQSRTILDLHVKSLGRISIKSSRSPILLSEMLAQSGENGLAVMEAALAMGGIRRAVDETGKIYQEDLKDLRSAGIFGINDSSPKEEGALIPLEGMMVLDILESHKEQEAEQIFHLGGRDMVKYTKDEHIIGRVDDLLQASRALLEEPQHNLVYSIVDTSSADQLASLADSNVKSQYDLITQRSNVGRRQVIIPPENYDKILAGE